MQKTATERRTYRRYDLRMPLRYHVSQKGAMPRSGTGLTCEMSSMGLSFHCRKPLPVGAHVEIVIDWPAKYGDVYPVDLQLTGFVLRSEPGKTAVKMTSHRFRVDSIRVETRVSA
jgi:hypothetical protein